MALIEVKNVTHYYSETLAVKNISFSVEQGDFVALIGRNGSGKSTVAKLLNGLLTPFSGNVLIDGINTQDYSNAFNVRKNVGVVFQNPDNQMVATIIEDDIAFGPENLGIPPEEIGQRVEWALSSVDMLEHRHGTATRLSGGQKQRIAIAGILAMKPKILVLDESTSMLDPKGRRKIMQVARELNQKEGITVIIITHYMDEAALANKIIVMNKGEIRFCGGKELFDNEELVDECGLELPISAQTANALIKNGVPINKGTITPQALIDEMNRLGLANNLEEELDVSKPDDFNSLGDVEAIADINLDNYYANNNSNEATNSATSANNERSKAVEVENLNYIYSPKSPFRVAAVKDLSLDIFEGEFFGIIGHTGSGKSTLVRHLNGLIRIKNKGEKGGSSGRIVVNGMDISHKFDYKALRSSVGMVFQYPEYQLFEETVARDIAFGPRNVGVPEEEIAQRVRESMRAVGIDETLAERSPFDLSGGQKRRVAIAGVIAMRPNILVLDEPTAGLDPKGRTEILATIHSIKQQFCPTIIMVSHNMDEIAEHCTRVAVLNEGKLFMQNSPIELFKKSQEIESIGLDVPTTSRIATSLGYSGVCKQSQLVQALLAAAVGKGYVKGKRKNAGEGKA